jgi:hypothetical protein
LVLAFGGRLVIEHHWAADCTPVIECVRDRPSRECATRLAAGLAAGMLRLPAERLTPAACAALVLDVAAPDAAVWDALKGPPLCAAAFA